LVGVGSQGCSALLEFFWRLTSFYFSHVVDEEWGPLVFLAVALFWRGPVAFDGIAGETLVAAHLL